MPKPPAPSCPETLDGVLADIWARLRHGKSDRRAAIHTPVVASVTGTGDPSQRVMVLRAVDPEAGTLRFHTDIRAPKFSEIGAVAPANVLAYDPLAGVQIRMAGIGTVQNQGAAVDSIWANTPAMSRRCYLAEPGPGAAADAPTSGLPLSLQSRRPLLPETEVGRQNFAILTITLHQLDWLLLTSQGNRRAVFLRDGQGWKGHWAIP